MLMVLSPAKTLDFESPLATQSHTYPELMAQAQLLVNRCRKLSVQELSDLMVLSEKLAILNVERFANWHPDYQLGEARQALLAFKGDVYTGLQADTFDEAEFEFAQQHLRILSGLYGVLKPLDLMLPYRLEMGRKLETERARDLYGFWGDQITTCLNLQLQTLGSAALINLASNEYFRSVKKDLLVGELITPIFKDYKNGAYKVISFHAKKARGMMARYIIEQRIKDPMLLQGFIKAGYRYDPEESTPSMPVFKRKQE